MGSTELRNVGRVVPSIHPSIEVVSKDASGNTIEFIEECLTSKGKAAMLVGAKVMAMTEVGLLKEPSLNVNTRSELNVYLDGYGIWFTI